MCDYSLMAIPNRLAVSGEELIVHKFEAEALGLASVSDLQTHQARQKLHPAGFWSSLKEFFNPDVSLIPAVCIPPGTRLLLRDIPAKLRRECHLRTDVEEAAFTQITAAVNTFRDAIRFNNGVEVLLQRLEEGQSVLVLEVSAGEEPLIPSGQEMMIGVR